MKPRMFIHGLAVISILIGIIGCVASEPIEVSAQEPAVVLPSLMLYEDPAQAAERLASNAAAQALEGSGEPVWAEGYSGQLIAGLDGGLYEPYRSGTIVFVQQALRARGLYAGELNGILDAPTMRAIYAFQEAHYNLQICGVPTPRTRRMLSQGSHTDLPV